MNTSTTLLLAALCATLHVAQAASPDPLRAVVDRTIAPLMRAHGVPGMAVGLTVDGRATVYHYGLASKEHGTPVDERTLFELGSVSKTFTALLACQARVAGKLSFADRPGKYLPALRGSAIDRATLLHLGTYTAGGLPQQFPDAVGGDADVPAWLRGWTPEAPAGAQRRYSNPSIGLLGHVTGLALGASADAAFDGQLFPALGLRHTHVTIPAQAMASYAWGVDSAGQPARAGADAFDAYTYAVKSNGADMIRYVQLQMAPAGLPAPLRKALACTHDGHFEVGPMVQGLGWEQYRAPVTLARLLEGNSDKLSRQFNTAVALTPPQAAPSGTLFNKTGATRGFSSYVAFVPSRRIGVVLLANKMVPSAARIAAAQALLDHLGALEAGGKQ